MKAPAIHPLVYYRLIALWVLCEAMLGGVVHGLKIPVSGLVVGSCAVICISLLAWYVPVKGAILKATLVVAIFKMMLSPQAPLPAYFAVFFQGVLGELLFWNRRFYMISCILLGLISLLESGLQRILVLTIIYGNDIWNVINRFLNGLTGQESSTNYSLLIGGAYVGIHILCGSLVGWWISTVPGKVERWSKEEHYWIKADLQGETISPVTKSRGNRMKKWIWVIWIFLIGLYVQSYFGWGAPLLPTHVSLRILLRSLIIVIAWIYIAGPLLRSWLQNWLQKRRSGAKPDIQKILELLPATTRLIRQSWHRSSNMKGWRRLQLATRFILVNALFERVEDERKLYMLTGPVQSGKTSALVNWAATRNEVSGILTPVVNGKRMFMDAETGNLFRMEAGAQEANSLQVGRFKFSKTQFEKAISIIEKAIDKKGWLVIDELGPLELRKEGFYSIASKALASRKGPILLVVRDTDDMVDKVKAFFQIPYAVKINALSELEG